MITTEKKNGINLYDILPICKISRRITREKSEIIDEYNLLKSKIYNLQEALKVSGLDLDYKVEILKKSQGSLKFTERINGLRKKFLVEFGYLPEDLKNSLVLTKSYSGEMIKEEKDHLRALSSTSTITGADVKSITDKFAFITIPYECLNEKSFENETYSMKERIRKFKNSFSEEFDIYVITPIEYYSLNNHVYNNAGEKQLYVGNHYQVFSSVLLNIPMFRGILNTISSINDRVNNLESQVEGIKNSISQMENTIKMLQKQVDKQQEQLILQKLEIKKQGEAMVKFEAMALRVIDPVMIAIKKGVDINTEEFDESICFIGPCWGPDFDENVSLALDLKIIKNQRNLLNKTVSELWN